MAYILTVFASMLLIALGNFLKDGIYTPSAFFTLLGTVALGVLLVVLVDGIFAFLIRRLPEGWFAPGSKAFSVGEGEARLYRRLKINRWKRFIPELGCFTGFRKDTLRETGSSAYLGRFLLESNYGVAGHLAGGVMGFSILFLRFLRPRSVALPVAIVNLFLNLLPTAILRANTPALLRLYKRSLAKEQAKTRTEKGNTL